MGAVVWRGSCRSRFAGWLAPIGVLIAAGGTWLVLSQPAGSSTGTPAAIALVPLVTGVVVALAAVVFTRVRLALDQSGVHARFGPGSWPRRDIPWRDVLSVQAVDVRAGPWGGWGYRWNPRRGTAAVLRQGPGLEFGLTDGRVFVVTVDDAEAGAHAASRWLADQPRPRP